jgi:hypothetical protein
MPAPMEQMGMKRIRESRLQGSGIAIADVPARIHLLDAYWFPTSLIQLGGKHAAGNQLQRS